jgi:hypothetical protein
MNLIELLFFVLAAVLSALFGRYFFGYIGWWGVLPAIFLGFGFVAVIVVALPKVFASWASRRK